MILAPVWPASLFFYLTFTHHVLISTCIVIDFQSLCISSYHHEPYLLQTPSSQTPSKTIDPDMFRVPRLTKSINSYLALKYKVRQG